MFWTIPSLNKLRKAVHFWDSTPIRRFHSLRINRTQDSNQSQGHKDPPIHRNLNSQPSTAKDTQRSDDNTSKECQTSNSKDIDQGKDNKSTALKPKLPSYQARSQATAHSPRIHLHTEVATRSSLDKLHSQPDTGDTMSIRGPPSTTQAVGTTLSRYQERHQRHLDQPTSQHVNNMSTCQHHRSTTLRTHEDIVSW
ncbi:hypothetical protein CAEBREN_18914 [Caenorhabditis brenneri]|uniref:Uncharacterized protein n=1 Tax=Caenorhabditis brenneri TaxID=135651 RepID=G0NDX3_CAEBE|nr:hypothetical protein CAEBREN_18914 [Caenorhabditis brenneri]